MGGLAVPALEDVMAAASGPMAYQIYAAGDRLWARGLVERVAASGFAAICLTADSAGPAFSDALRRHHWAPKIGRDHPNIVGSDDRGVSEHMARLTWDDLAWLRSVTELPLMLKGVLTPQDALLAVEHGVDVVYVSNHGGLVLDYGPAVVEVLPELAQVVAGNAQIIADGGVMRGTDVVKALGADAVAIGRLACWALAAGVADVLVRAIQILNEEITPTMANMGASTIADLVPELVAKSDPLPPVNV